MNEIPFNSDTVLHHIQHLLLYTIILWQVILGLSILIKLYFKYYIPKINNYIPQYTNQNDNVIDDNLDKKNNKNLNVIDVEVKKDIFIEKADSLNVKADKVVKGKVKTQKDKLKKLRGGK